MVSDFEIIIVNDGSQDRTGILAEQLAEQYAEVRVVHNSPNLGYGGALQRGFKEARKEWVFYTDGDGQFDFNELSRIVPLVKDYDIVSAFRVRRADHLIRKVNAWAWGTLMNMLFDFSIKDVDCAFKLYPRRLFDQIQMTSRGQLIDTEILARARKLGYRIGQIGVRHLPRTAGTQTGNSFRAITQAFKELIPFYREMRRANGSVLPPSVRFEAGTNVINEQHVPLPENAISRQC